MENTWHCIFPTELKDDLPAILQDYCDKIEVCFPRSLMLILKCAWSANQGNNGEHSCRKVLWSLPLMGSINVHCCCIPGCWVWPWYELCWEVRLFSLSIGYYYLTHVLHSPGESENSSEAGLIDFLEPPPLEWDTTDSVIILPLGGRSTRRRTCCLCWRQISFIYVTMMCQICRFVLARTTVPVSMNLKSICLELQAHLKIYT